MTIEAPGVQVQKLYMRLHTRTMVRDGLFVFLGSQSLRSLELDARREVGAIFRNAKAAAQLLRTFNEDWAKSEEQQQQSADAGPTARASPERSPKP